MRSLFLVLFSLVAVFAVANNDDPVLLTIDGRDITLSEFEYIYEKNNSGDVIDKKTIDEYMDLYVRFKLKVIDAENMGMDTVPVFINEFRGYRNQLTRTYLIDQELEDSLYQEAYNHLKEDIELAHIMFRLPNDPSPADTLKVFLRADSVYNRLQNENFEAVAVEVSEDPSVKENKGYMGFVTGLSVVWPLEKEMYALPVGKVSKPIRTSYGYHIIRVLSRRPAAGQIRASHIMVKTTDKMSEADLEKAHQKILDIKKRLDEGADFEDLAKNESEDRASAIKGGDLSWFGIGRMVLPFEKAAFALTKGEVSEPVKTDFGWHIIKLTDRRGIDSFENKKADIQKFMQYDERSVAPEKAFLKKLRAEYGLSIDEKALSKADSLIKVCAGNNSMLQEKANGLDMNIIIFKDENVPVNEFIAYYVRNGNSRPLRDVLNELADIELVRYEDSILEDKYPEFGHLMNEYHDGLLLFDVSNKMVWEKAARDTAGLKQYFADHRKEYKWNKKRFKGFVVRCANKETEERVKELYKTISTDSLVNYVRTTLNSDSAVNVFIERGIWAEGDNEIVDRYAFKNKNNETPVNEFFPIIFTLGKVLKKYPESYEDVRGAVTTAYQNYLEQQWIEQLKVKYPVVINESVFETLKAKKN